MVLDVENQSECKIRKCSKPVMEKRRRARINKSLNDLKHLVLDALNKDSSCYSKLEKADILEMTVKHLRSLHSQQNAVNIASDPSVISKYRAGFNECMTEVSKYLTANSAVDAQSRTRILSHLASTVHKSRAVTEGAMYPASFPVVQLTCPIPGHMKPVEATPGHCTVMAIPVTEPQQMPTYVIPAKDMYTTQAHAQFVPIYSKDFNSWDPLAQAVPGSAAPMRLSLDGFWRPW